jgi:predicted metalloprotease
MGLFGGGEAQVEPAPPGGVQETGLPTDELAQFVSVVLADTEDTWTEVFRGAGQQYAPPRLVLFESQVRSACGVAGAAVGPFYCPADQKVYIDLAFYDELRRRFQAPGDFAQAYVIAHEVGHHVQNLLGTAQQVHERQQRTGEREANQLSVRLELQADCYAGVWANRAHRARQIIEQGDVEEALGAASAVGDDTIQKRTQGQVVPESFTHGSAEQRMQWFQRGLQSGSPDQCDTFGQAR